MKRKIVKREHFYEALLSLLLVPFGLTAASAPANIIAGILLIALAVIVISALAFASHLMHP